MFNKENNFIFLKYKNIFFNLKKFYFLFWKLKIFSF